MKKNLILLLFISSLSVQAQNYKKDWHLLYSPQDTNYGTGLTEGIKAFPVPADAKTVIVAVIDDGVDFKHPDLADNIWVNSKEIPGNAVDDDHNGYIDDIHGWDYLGSAGVDIEYDNLELTRLLRNYQKKFEGKSSKGLSKADKNEYKSYKKLQALYDKKLATAKADYKALKYYNNLCNTLTTELDSPTISLANLLKFEPKSVESKLAYSFVVDICLANNMQPKELFDALREDYIHISEVVNYHLNLDYDPRPTVGDNYEETASLGYGNMEVRGPDARHGTHVAGIIAALRNNNLGIDGMAPLVKIMILRTVPNGDERDKDVAHAIRYAVDNGAKVINMSFGKAYSYNSAIVKAAILYAESKDVLMIHAAGNDNANIDKVDNFPNAEYLKDSFCKTWIEVGASDRNQSPAYFSNYGKQSVDVFAPGVQIYSCIPDNQYKAMDGTSMASPVVAGLAALIRAYFPHLTAIQVKQAIESSVVKPKQKVKVPGKKRKKKKYKKLCKTGGIINAPNALKAAAAMK